MKIKQYISGSLLLLSAVLLTASCKEYLDKEPKSDIPSTQPYLNFKNFQGFVEELYTAMPIMTSHQYHGAWNFGVTTFGRPVSLVCCPTPLTRVTIGDGTLASILISRQSRVV